MPSGQAESMRPPPPPSQAPSDESDEIEEGAGLLSGKPTRNHAATPAKRRKWREIGLFAWALIASSAFVILAVVLQHNSQPAGREQPASAKGKRNLIFMVSDGMGPTSLTMTRSWQQYVEDLPYNAPLFLDEYMIGQSRTRSSSSLVTDSAAGATAFSCGDKSYNGAISVLPNHQPCGSIMEAAKRMGYTTGLVVTTRLTDATPAVFVSHVRNRDMESEIALQMVGETHPLGRMVDLMIGGGRCYFLPNTTSGSCRNDDTDVVGIAQEAGWSYIDSRKDFDALVESDSVSLPLLSLLAYEDIPYEIDRRHVTEEYPSLEEETRLALRTLAAATKDSEHGFFVMIEGSRIDHAGHANDPAAQVHEVLAYDRAMAAVFDFIESSDVPTLMVATSDHETGGLATARQIHEAYPDYLWFPGVLANATQSVAYTAHTYLEHLRSIHPVTVTETNPLSPAEQIGLRPWLSALTATALGIYDVSRDELDLLITRPALAAYTFADMISRRAQTGWSTHGHSGADVNIYTSDPRLAKTLRGNNENTDIGTFLRSYLDAEDEVNAVTAELRAYTTADDAAPGLSWLGPEPEQGQRLDGQDHLEHYTGDHKLRRGSRCEVCGM